MTDQQAKALAFIRAQLLGGGTAPSLREVARHLGFGPRSHAKRIVDALVDGGDLVRTRYATRGLALPPATTACPSCGAGGFAISAAGRAYLDTHRGAER